MIRISVKENIDPNLLTGRASKLEKALAWQILKDTDEFVPALTGVFAGMAHVIGNVIIYTGPQVHYLWHGVAMVNSATGKGPRYIPEVGWRWPKGAILKPTNRPLNFNTSMHAKAQSHWMDASRAQNMKKWDKIALKVYTDG